MSSTVSHLSRNVRTFRASRGLGVRALSERAGVPASTVTRIEHGKTANIESVVNIAAALGVTVDDLLRAPSEHDMRLNGPIGAAYAQYDRDPRAHGPNGFEAFADAIEPLLACVACEAQVSRLQKALIEVDRDWATSEGYSAMKEDDFVKMYGLHHGDLTSSTRCDHQHQRADWRRLVGND